MASENFDVSNSDGLFTGKSRYRDFNEGFKNLSRNDFEGYIDRMLYLYAAIPIENKNTRKDDLDSILAFFFNGAELHELSKKIEQANLKLNQYNSMPKLTLGLKQKISQEGLQSVYEGAQFLCEFFHDIGIMGKEESEQIMLQKVSTLLMHDSKFQANPRYALEFLARSERIT